MRVRSSLKSFSLQELKKLPASLKKESLFLKADKTVPYGYVVNIMPEIKAAGFNKLGMITTPTQKN
nr:biopolymer transporter ExbD [Desulfotalea psychrophila]